MTDHNEDDLWQALLACDGSRTGTAVYAVATTGVYCRIGCPSRPPLRRNVTFHATAAAAQAAGYRPCKRCFRYPGSPRSARSPG